VPDLALVCGAHGVLGRAVVDAFLARGDHVVAVGRDLLEHPPSDPRLHAETADLAVADDVEALWERLERQDRRPRWVVNVAGGFRPGSVADSDPDHVRFVHDLNLSTVWWSCRAAARRLPAGAAMVNVASRSAVSGGRGAAAYAVANAGVTRLTEVLAAELAEARIRVNAILPSLIDTPDNRAAMSAERMRVAVPPGEVAAVASFLCSDAAAVVTGALVPVYGWA
jgi:NAD(P)-dependent dehydrogenase (short-subunit alcohol dehydrogenase family)